MPHAPATIMTAIVERAEGRMALLERFAELSAGLDAVDAIDAASTSPDLAAIVETIKADDAAFMTADLNRVVGAGWMDDADTHGGLWLVGYAVTLLRRYGRDPGSPRVRRAREILSRLSRL